LSLFQPFFKLFQNVWELKSVQCTQINEYDSRIKSNLCLYVHCIAKSQREWVRMRRQYTTNRCRCCKSQHSLLCFFSQVFIFVLSTEDSQKSSLFCKSKKINKTLRNAIGKSTWPDNYLSIKFLSFNELSFCSYAFFISCIKCSVLTCKTIGIT